MRDGVQLAHVLLGSAGLLLGPAAVFGARGWRHGLGVAYHVAVGGVVVSAVALSLTAFARLWWLLPVALATQTSALVGLWVWRRRPRGWPTASAHLLGGSHVALVTGILIAGTGNPLFWLAPAIVAQWPIAVAKRRLRQQGNARTGSTAADPLLPSQV